MLAPRNETSTALVMTRIRGLEILTRERNVPFTQQLRVCLFKTGIKVSKTKAKAKAKPEAERRWSNMRTNTHVVRSKCDYHSMDFGEQSET